jgi:capsular polysaccharide biosynthesis protein
VELRASLRVIRRRWPVVAIGLVLIIVAMAKVARVPPRIQATVTVLLTPPTLAGGTGVNSGNPAQQNPFLGIGTDLTVVGRVEAAAVSDGTVANRLTKAGATAQYTVSPVATGPSSDGDHAILITAEDPDTATASWTAEAVVQALQDDIAARQKALAIPVRDWIRTQPIGQPAITRFNKTKVRLLAAIGAGGLAGMLMVTFALEALSRRRRISSLVRRAATDRPASALHRRWYLAVLGVPVIAVGIVGAVKRVPPSYRAASTMVLLPPRLPPDPTVPADKQGTQNPFLSYSDSFDIVAQLTTSLVSAPATRAELAKRGLAGSYQVVNWVQGPDPVSTLGDPTPVIFVSATAGSAEAADHIVDIVSQAFKADLTKLQAGLGAPAVTQIAAQTVTPAQAYQLHGSKIRALAAFGALGLAGLGLLVTLIDRGLIWAGSIRRDRRPHEDGQPGIGSNLVAFGASPPGLAAAMTEPRTPAVSGLRAPREGHR